MQEEIYRKIRKFAEETSMFEQAAGISAGVSGGGDSTAMLDLLIRLREEYGFRLQVVHVNHKIRGEEAQRDQRLVEELCREKDIPCRVYTYDVPYLADKWKTGYEEAGRKVRKEAFFAAENILRQKTGEQGRILTALAHNKNDASSCQGSGDQGAVFYETGKRRADPSSFVYRTERN